MTSGHEYKAQIDSLKKKLHTCQAFRDREDTTLIRLLQVYPEIKEFLESHKSPSKKNLKNLDLDMDRVRVLTDAAKVEEIKRENTQLKIQNSNIQRRLNDILVAVGPIEKQNETLSNELEATVQKLNDSEAKLGEQTKERAALKAKVQELEQENAYLETQVKAKRQTSDERREADRNLKAELKTLKAALAESKGIAKQYEEKNKELIAENRALNISLKAQGRRTVVKQDRQDIAITHDPIVECEEHPEEKKDFEALIDEQKGYITILQGQVSELKTQLSQQNGAEAHGVVRSNLQYEMQQAAEEPQEHARINELEAQLKRCKARYKIVGTVSRKRTSPKEGIRKHLQDIKEKVKATFRTDEQKKKEAAKIQYRQDYTDAEARDAARNLAFGRGNKSSSGTRIIDRIKRFRKPLNEDDKKQKELRDQYRKIKKGNRHWESMLTDK